MSGKSGGERHRERVSRCGIRALCNVHKSGGERPRERVNTNRGGIHVLCNMQMLAERGIERE